MNRNLRSIVPEVQHKFVKNFNKNKYNNFLDKKKQKMKKYYDKNKKQLSPLKNNYLVKIQIKPRTPWKNGKIVKKVGIRSYLVKLENGSVLKRNRKFIKEFSSSFSFKPRQNLTGSNNFYKFSSENNYLQNLRYLKVVDQSSENINQTNMPDTPQHLPNGPHEALASPVSPPREDCIQAQNKNKKQVINSQNVPNNTLDPVENVLNPSENTDVALKGCNVSNSSCSDENFEYCNSSFNHDTSFQSKSSLSDFVGFPTEFVDSSLVLPSTSKDSSQYIEKRGEVDIKTTRSGRETKPPAQDDLRIWLNGSFCFCCAFCSNQSILTNQTSLHKVVCFSLQVIK